MNIHEFEAEALRAWWLVERVDDSHEMTLVYMGEENGQEIHVRPYDHEYELKWVNCSAWGCPKPSSGCLHMSTANTLEELLDRANELIRRI